jgi:putative ABC transport system permease protein
MILSSSTSIQNFFFAPLPNGVIFALLVIGVFLSFRILDVADLSVEGIIPLTTVVTAILIHQGINCFVALLISAFIGLATGLLNSLLTVYLKIPALLSGIIMMAANFGLSIVFMSLNGGVATFAMSAHLTAFNWLGNGLKVAGLSSYYANYLSYIIVGGAILALIAFALYFFFGTELGMSIRAAGKNKHMSRANGIQVKGMFMIGLSISGALVGIAGSLYAQHNGFGYSTDGTGMIVVGLSSLFLGELIFGQKSFKRGLLASIVGSFLYWYIIQVLMLIDTNGYLLNFYKAILLVVVILLGHLVKHVTVKINNKKNRMRMTQEGERETIQSPSEMLQENFSHFVLGAERKRS